MFTLSAYHAHCVRTPQNSSPRALSHADNLNIASPLYSPLRAFLPDCRVTLIPSSYISVCVPQYLAAYALMLKQHLRLISLARVHRRLLQVRCDRAMDVPDPLPGGNVR